MAKNDLEIEKKYIIHDEETFLKIKEEASRLAIPGLKATKFAGPLIRHDTYYDTAANALLGQSMAFRMGLKSANEARLTFKAPTNHEHTRREIEESLSPASAERRLRGKENCRVIAALREVIGAEPIFPRLRVSKLFWALDGRDWFLVFGFVTYAGARGALERFDLEVEAKREGDAQLVEKVGGLLRDRYRLREDPRSKYEVGMTEVG